MGKYSIRLGYTVPILKLVFIALLLSSFSFSRGSISGILKDNSSNKPIPNALVQLYSSKGLIKEKRSNYRGAFTFWNIKNGRYYLVIKKRGYQGKITDSIVIDGVIMPTEIEYPNILLSKQITVPKSPVTPSPKVPTFGQDSSSQSLVTTSPKVPTSGQNSSSQSETEIKGSELTGMLVFSFFLLYLFFRKPKKTASIYDKEESSDLPKKKKPKPKLETEKTPIKFKKGDYVEHANLGIGKVLATSGQGENQRVGIVFKDGAKKLVVKFANLAIAENPSKSIMAQLDKRELIIREGRFEPKREIKKSPSTFEVGNYVEHANLGIGKVLATSGQGENQRVGIVFKDGAKKLVVKFANLAIAENPSKSIMAQLDKRAIIKQKAKAKDKAKTPKLKTRTKDPKLKKAKEEAKIPKLLSTSALAKKRGLSSQKVITELKINGFIKRSEDNSRWLLTAQGRKIGGIYNEEKYFGKKYIIWPETLKIPERKPKPKKQKTSKAIGNFVVLPVITPMSASLKKVFKQKIVNPVFTREGTEAWEEVVKNKINKDGLFDLATMKQHRIKYLGQGRADFTKSFKGISSDELALLYCFYYLQMHFTSSLAIFNNKSSIIIEEIFKTPYKIAFVDIGCGPYTSGLAFLDCIRSKALKKDLNRLQKNVTLEYYGIDIADSMLSMGDSLLSAYREETKGSGFHFSKILTSNDYKEISDLIADGPEKSAIIINCSYLFGSTSLDVSDFVKSFNRLINNNPNAKIFLFYQNPKTSQKDISQKYIKFKNETKNLIRNKQESTISTLDFSYENVINLGYNKFTNKSVRYEVLKYN